MVGKPENLSFRGAGGLKTPKITKNMPKLGYYLPFEQKIQKWNFFVKKPKNQLFRGLGVAKTPKQPKICQN